MRLLEIADATSFLKLSSSLLLEREDENNLLLSSAMTLAKTATPRSTRLSFFVAEDSTGVVCSGMNLTGKRLLLTRTSNEVAEFMANEMTAREVTVNGIFGPAESTDVFATTWGVNAVAMGTPDITSKQTQLAYKLTDKLETEAGWSPSEGLCRVAQRKDLKLLSSWARLFVEEAKHEDSAAETEEVLRRALDQRQLFIWEDHKIVAMAGYGGLTPNGARVNMVYTERSCRSRGYAGSLVQSLTHKLLSQGGRRFCFLFVDATNPAASKSYSRLGYKQIAEFSDYRAAVPSSPAAFSASALSVSTTGK